MLSLNNVVLIFLLFMSLAVSYAFAENPTPYNEWDFDFGEIEISQDPRNLDDMIILIPVLYKGDMGLGTVEISARVSNPDGSQFTHPQTVSNMEIGQKKTVKVTHRMSFDGTYIIDMKMTPPEKPYLGHIFDTETLTYVVEPNGREYQLEVSGSDTVEETAYHLDHPEDVKYYEIVHAVINLPKENSYEKILVTNDK